MLRRLVAAGVTIGLFASVLLGKPGVVTNRQGDVFKGDITQDEKFVYVDSTGGQLKLDKRNVSKIEYTATLDDQYAERHSKLAANDVKGRVALASWADQNGRVDLAVTALQEALAIDPANHDVALALQSDQRQMDLDESAGKAKKNPAVPATPVAPAVAPVTSVSPTVPEKPKAERRLLTNDEVNLIRQREMDSTDTGIKIRFDNGVVKRYLSTGDRDAAAFNQLSPLQQAGEILNNGDAKMANDVRVMTDPAPLVEFKKKIMPLIASSCASTACHGGTKAGDFALYSGDSANTVYTNFFILQMYSKTISGTKYLAVDREVPGHSLVLQFGLPVSVGVPPHPSVPNWRPRFRSQSDPAYMDIEKWMSKSLKVLQPDYGINVAAKLPPPPATDPAK